MHRRSGKTVSPKYYLVVELLSRNELYSAAEIASLKYDRRRQKNLYDRMYGALYRFGERNGLTLNPDNCLRDHFGRPMIENGKIKLKFGDRQLRWYGKTWKSKLCYEDRQEIHKYVCKELILTLLIRREQIEIQVTSGSEKPEKSDSESKKNKRSISFFWKWFAVAFATIFLFWIIASDQEPSREQGGFAEFVQTRQNPRQWEIKTYDRPDKFQLQLQMDWWGPRMNKLFPQK